MDVGCDKRGAIGKSIEFVEGADSLGRASPDGMHDGVKLLAQYAGDPVLIEDGRHLVATFHPELTGDTRVHSLFLDKL